MSKKNQKKKNKKRDKSLDSPTRDVVKLVLAEDIASKMTLKLKSEIEMLAGKIERQEHVISSYLHDMSEPAEAVGEKLMRERAVLEVLRMRLDQRKFEFEESQIADAEAAHEEVARQVAQLQQERFQTDATVLEKLCELYPASEAKRLLKDSDFRCSCPLTAPLISKIEETEQRLRAAEELVRKIRSEFFMAGTRSNGSSASGTGSEDEDFLEGSESAPRNSVKLSSNGTPAKLTSPGTFIPPTNGTSSPSRSQKALAKR